VVWLALFAMFAVPAVLAFAVRALFGRLSWNATHRWQSEPIPDDHMTTAGAIIFDRRRDVTKLEGCNTRNVQYRWSIFTRWVGRLLERCPAPAALDVGAGSLRDTYELATRGLKVDALDLNAEQLHACWNAYDWSSASTKPRLITGSLAESELSPDSYDLVLAFDVIEHLRDLEVNLATLARLLTRNGLVFVTVPNRRAAFERLFRLYYKRQLSRGILDTSGVPHLSFKSPSEWDDTFRRCGFAVLDHEMAIGFLVNDIWQATFAIPLRTFVDPVIQSCCARLGRPYRTGVIEHLLYPRWWMRLVNELDEALKPIAHSLWGWNLLVLGRSEW
jgi:2-polyprenyl-3-methyl-5-hydroxy-6-metoxy-1,4-benzoquinol methylase